jgi:hypothetical protein
MHVCSSSCAWVVLLDPHPAQLLPFAPRGCSRLGRPDTEADPAEPSGQENNFLAGLACRIALMRRRTDSEVGPLPDFPSVGSQQGPQRLVGAIYLAHLVCRVHSGSESPCPWRGMRRTQTWSRRGDVAVDSTDGTIRGGSGVWPKNNGARCGCRDVHIMGGACWGDLGTGEGTDLEGPRLMICLFSRPLLPSRDRVRARSLTCKNDRVHSLACHQQECKNRFEQK